MTVFSYYEKIVNFQKNLDGASSLPSFGNFHLKQRKHHNYADVADNKTLNIAALWLFFSHCDCVYIPVG